jgi:Zn-dependent peptidase ImmA (M78 family)/transcriptional regulator with XRE-family HTH domain
MTDIASRVRQVLEGSGLTQREFGARIGLDDSKLSKSLAGTRRFSSLDLARISDSFSVPVDWLITGVESPLALAARSTGEGARRAITRARTLTTLRTDLGALGYPQRPAETPRVTGAGGFVRQGEELAAVAGRLVEAAGRSVLDEDLARLIEDVFGIDVAVEDLGEQFDGLAASRPDARLILANACKVPARQRFTLAHELAHLLAGDDQGIHVDKDVYQPNGRQDPSEGRANAFAAAFLMPDGLLRERIGDSGLTLAELGSLAFELMVSPSSLAYRLFNLHLIDAGTRDGLARVTEKEAARQAGRTDELARRLIRSCSARPPGLLARDAFAAYEAGHATLRPYAALIGVDVEELRTALESGSEVAAQP